MRENVFGGRLAHFHDLGAKSERQKKKLCSPGARITYIFHRSSEE